MSIIYKKILQSLLLLMLNVLVFAQQEIKVMSYNIRLDVAADGENRWDARKDKVASMMNYNAADFIGGQEVQAHQLKYLLENMPGYHFIGVGRDDGKSEGEFSCIFYNKEKFMVVKQSTFWLSPTPDSVSIGWDAAYKRVCTYGLFKSKKTNQLCWVFNTHLDHMGSTARLESVKLIAEKIQQFNNNKNYPVILTGDFNSKPDEAPVQFVNNHFQNARLLCILLPHGPEATWNGFEFDKTPESCIDYIFISNQPQWTVKNFATLTDSYQKKYPSDHFPVLATLVFNPINKNKIADAALLNLVQKQTFNYFWDGAEPVSGMARERIHVDGIYPENDKNVVTSGGSGFGVMAIIVGMERKFISREDGVQRLEKIVHFLETADRFHGAWPHWWNGETGKVQPFGQKDNGGDLVETSYMIQGLLCVRQYFKDGNATEKLLANRIDKLWKQVEFDWYRNGQNVLYWHWSPEYVWQMNFPVHGYNECLIMYVLAASSPTHSVPAAVYHEGWAEGGKIKSAHKALGYPLQLRYQGNPPNGAPLFWSHYSYLGLDPRNLKDRYADYWKENTNQTFINYSWCVANPKKYIGYGKNNWGLTASYSIQFYKAHAPDLKNDLGVISPTAALSSFPYSPKQSMAAMRHWYDDMKEKLWGPYGFYDAFSETENWFPKKYLAIDQGPEVVMIENYRSGLLWKLFMSCPEIKTGLKKLGFENAQSK